ncbi:divergent polysaccharide deacetylase family protein [bacterium]|nr:MAG: divergent polysaccharide deacetylase family protein [bacterium]
MKTGKKKKGGARPKKRRGGRFLKFLLFLALAGAALYFSSGYLKGLYVSALQRDVEDIVGTLTDDGILLDVGDEKAAGEIVDGLKSIQRRSFGLMKVRTGKPRPNRVSGFIEFGKSSYGFSIIIEGKRVYEGKPKLAVIIDDMGGSFERDKKFFDLGIPVTPSVLPFLRSSEATAKLAAQKGRPFLLHMPMEPNPKTEANPGEGAILKGMGEQKTRELVGAALLSVRGAAGVNNHMGSRATEDEQVMDYLMSELSVRGLFFVDSLTTGGSAGARSAKRYGVPFSKRDVFLDNSQEEEAIGEKIEEAVDIALRTGSAIAIGHSHDSTLEALRRWTPMIKSAGVEVVTVDRLVKADN